jgi:hypothetical protein
MVSLIDDGSAPGAPALFRDIEKCLLSSSKSREWNVGIFSKSVLVVAADIRPELLVRCW